MNQKPILKLFSLKGSGPPLIPRPMITLVITLAMLSLYVLTACSQVPVSVPEVKEAAPALAPEAVAQEEPASDSAYLAANPELLKAHPPAGGQAMTESEFLAANPELKDARRYAGALENEVDPDRDIGLLDFFTPNDQRPVTFDKAGLQQSYFQDWAIEANAPDALKPALSLNTPEQTLDFWIKVLSRAYHRQAQPPRLSPAIHPVTFDSEELRQTYFQDWTIEADQE